MHEAVLIQGHTIRYANPQFANLMGCSVQELLGRRLEDLVPPDHMELVRDNMRRRLAGEPAAERYEIDLVGLTGQSTRLELSTWLLDFEGEHALLIVGVEVLPTQTLQALQEAGGRSRSRRALESLTEALITTDVDGRVDYINPAAARLMGVVAEEAAGTMLEDLAAGCGGRRPQAPGRAGAPGVGSRYATESGAARADDTATPAAPNIWSSCRPRRCAWKPARPSARWCCCTM